MEKEKYARAIQIIFFLNISGNSMPKKYPGIHTMNTNKKVGKIFVTYIIIKLLISIQVITLMLTSRTNCKQTKVFVQKCMLDHS